MAPEFDSIQCDCVIFHDALKNRDHVFAATDYFVPSGVIIVLTATEIPTIGVFLGKRFCHGAHLDFNKTRARGLFAGQQNSRLPRLPAQAYPIY